MDEVKDETKREPYEAPSIEDMPLRAEEQLLAGCKMPATAGPAAFVCGPCTSPRSS